ncbi:MAG: (2Fe-2S)-binding protein [Thermoleophilia bacterium]|nr:(2Fe-2S)-binding protein [Thermoleophilia bacterium]
MRTEVELIVNGRSVRAAVEPRKSLLHLLRVELGLIGTKEGCAEGDCGACVVLVDGKPINSCLLLALECEGREVTTIEGLGATGELEPLQEAFIQAGAVQCGYCTPGMILAAKALLDRIPDPTPEDVKNALVGHLCRCTGYAKILEAVQLAAQMSRSEGVLIDG